MYIVIELHPDSTNMRMFTDADKALAHYHEIEKQWEVGNETSIVLGTIKPNEDFGVSSDWYGMDVIKQKMYEDA